jgi:pyruvyl transferase EpsO
MEPHNFKKQVIMSYPDNKIIIFPQTVFYENEKNLKNDIQLFNSHKNLTICARDKISYEILKKHFTANILLVPDMAFCIPPESLLQYKKTSIRKNLFIKRKDKEFNPSYNYEEFENKCDIADWYADSNPAFLYLQEFLQVNQRLNGKFAEFIDFYANTTFKDYMIKEGVELLSKYEKIYTTRLHCAILCCLLDKPVFIFNNSYGKNKNFYETWLKEIEEVRLL